MNEEGEANQRLASPSRVRRIMAIGCALAAVGLLGVAWQTTRAGDDEVVLQTTSVTIDPQLLPRGNTDAETAGGGPLATTAVASPNSVAVTVAGVPSTLPRSPLADQLGDMYSALPVLPSDGPTPIGLQIDAIGVGTDAVVPVGIDDNNELDIPGASEVGWYQLGQRPGQPGATVLAAHVSWKKQAGVFARLGRLEPGSEVVVRLSDGSQARYVVTERTMYDKTALPYDRIWTRQGQEVLVLVTCGGEFNPEIRRYRQNIVVYAVPIVD